jgi:hypothetical protein
MSFRRKGRKRSQFMARRAKALAAAGKKAAKRPRNPRISSYLTPSEHTRFERYRKRLGCDASLVVRGAVLGLLKGMEPSETGAALEVAADRERCRQITFRLMWLLQAVHWDPMVLPPDEPLEKHFDAALITESLARIKPELRSLMRRVAELAVPKEAPPGQAQDTSSNDASPANPEGANPS